MFENNMVSNFYHKMIFDNNAILDENSFATTTN